jgi:hypothetical protein
MGAYHSLLEGDDDLSKPSTDFDLDSVLKNATTIDMDAAQESTLDKFSKATFWAEKQTSKRRKSEIKREREREREPNLKAYVIHLIVR